MRKHIFTFFMTAVLSLNASLFAGELYKSNVEASYYGDKFHGSQTANGEIFDVHAMTAAHKTLPFNTYVKVTNLGNGKTVVVRINDRGPFAGNREIDVSKAAAIELGMIQEGLARVSLEIVRQPEPASIVLTETRSVPSVPSSTTIETPYSGTTYPVTSYTTVPVTTSETIVYEADPNQRWDVQLGAYSSQEYANDMASALAQAGFNNIAFQQSNGIIRVVLRDVATRDLDPTIARLKAAGIEQYLVRRRNAGGLTTATTTYTAEK